MHEQYEFRFGDVVDTSDANGQRVLGAENMKTADYVNQHLASIPEFLGPHVAALVDAARASEADAQALADMRTLDDWAAQHEDNRVNTNHYGAHGCHPGWSVQLVSHGIHRGQYYGSTPDEARAKAAAWVSEQKR